MSEVPSISKYAHEVGNQSLRLPRSKLPGGAGGKVRDGMVVYCVGL